MTVEVIFKQIGDAHSDNLLLNVNDSILLTKWRDDNQSYSSLLLAEDKKTNNIVFI